MEKGHKVIFFGGCRQLRMHNKYEVSISYRLKVKANVKVFRLVGQRSWSRSLLVCHEYWYHWKGLMTKETSHDLVKYRVR